MKKLIILLFILMSINIYSQNYNSNKHYLNISIDNGGIIDIHNCIDPFKKDNMGLGVSLNYLIPSKLTIGAGFNYYTFGISLIDYPHIGEKYFMNFNDGEDNAFHYVKILMGYRMSLRLSNGSGNYFYYSGYNKIEGLSLEMRAGIVLYDRYNKPSTWIMSPKLVYVYNNIELSAYSDLCIGTNPNLETNLGGNIVLTAGFSIGYNFKL